MNAFRSGKYGVRFGARPSCGAGSITSYRLSQEELDALNRRCPPPASSKGLQPLCLPEVPSRSPQSAHEEATDMNVATNRRTILSKERYLELRHAGHTTEQIARDHNCTHRALQAMRGRWRLIADEDEVAALAAMDASGESESADAELRPPDALVAEPDPSQECVGSGAEGPDENFGAWASRVMRENLQTESLPRNLQDPAPSTEESSVLIRIPLRAIQQWIEGVDQGILSAPKLHRQTSLRLSYDMALEALGGSLLELEDLLGDGDTAGHLQRYIDRKLAAYLEARG